MRNDVLYCIHCKHVFRDTMRTYKYYKVQDTMLEDSRFNTKYKNVCPFCLCVNTMNASVIIDKGDSLVRSLENEGGSYDTLGNWTKRDLYLKLKKAVKSQHLNTTDDNR